MRQYVIRTPAHRGTSIGSKVVGFRRSTKREAISLAKWLAGHWMDEGKTIPQRRVSVYVLEGGKRPTLLYQAHWSRKFKRIISEQL